MEPDESKIENLLKQLIMILQQNDEHEFAYILNKNLNKFLASPSKDSVREILKSFQGTTGSLNDLILQKDGKILEANDTLDMLMDQLYKACVDYFTKGAESFF